MPPTVLNSRLPARSRRRGLSGRRPRPARSSARPRSCSMRLDDAPTLSGRVLAFVRDLRPRLPVRGCSGVRAMSRDVRPPDDQRLRALQDRHRPVELAHRRADGRGEAVPRDAVEALRGAEPRASPSSSTARCLDRARARHRSRRLPRPPRRARRRSIDPDSVAAPVQRSAAHAGSIAARRRPSRFDPASDIIFNIVDAAAGSIPTACASAPSTASATALARRGLLLDRRRLRRAGGRGRRAAGAAAVPYPFDTAAPSCWRLCGDARASRSRRFSAPTRRRCAPRPRSTAGSTPSGDAMFACIDRGLSIDGELPGGLRVKRRAKALFDALRTDAARTAPPARGDGLGQHLRHRRQRGERRRRPRRHRADERRRRHHPGGAALLPRFLPRVYDRADAASSC